MKKTTDDQVGMSGLY